MKKYIHYGHTKFDKDMFIKIRNDVFGIGIKPIGGLWASDIDARYGWKDWCDANCFRDCKKENSFTFTLTDNAKVLTINSVNDLDALPKAKDRLGLWILLDYEKISEMYDVLEVNISNDYDLYFKLYGYDCDSIIVMNPDVIVEI